jgi:4-aminobutyrate aminotransferase/(S)-3-amino-2-methylpropionate transaminase
MLNLEYRLPQQRRLLTPVPGPASTALAARRAGVVARAVSSSVPVYAVEADGGVVVDADGNSFIDFGSGIAVTSVGASNAAVTRAVAEAASRFTHTCFMVTPYEDYVAVCEELSALAPGGHAKKAALFNSGAEAVENAVKIARHATGRDAVIAFEHAYHGRTNLTMALTSKAMPYKAGFGPFAPSVYRVPVSYPFRDPDGMTGEQAAERAIGMIATQVGAERVAAVLIEPVLGEGGFIVPADGFLVRLAGWCRDNGVVLIADEVQAGFCRTGSWFACEQAGVEPDIITVAKGIAGGLPLAGVVGRAELMDAPHAGGLGGTYGGNPVACAAALAAIGYMKQADLNARALDIGSVITEVLGPVAEASPIVGELRGRGAMMALEFVQPHTKDPNPDVVRRIIAACLQAGVLILSCGTYGNVVRLLPPLVIAEDLLRDGLGVLADAIQEASA